MVIAKGAGTTPILGIITREAGTIRELAMQVATRGELGATRTLVIMANRATEGGLPGTNSTPIIDLPLTTPTKVAAAQVMRVATTEGPTKADDSKCKYSFDSLVYFMTPHSIYLYIKFLRTPTLL